MGDVLDDMYNGQTPSRNKSEYWNGNIKWLSSGELNRGTVYDSMEMITEDGQKSANLRIVPKGTFIMAITGLEAAGTRGNCALLGFDTTLNQSCMALFPKKDLLTSDFLFQWYRKVGEEYGINYTQGTKQQSYNAELIKILPISLPSVAEQRKIASYLSNLDHLITLHQRKCDEIKNLKKYMLQKMFPQNEQKVPEIRFEGFTEAWEQRKLKEVLSFLKDGTHGTHADTVDGPLLLSAKNIKDGTIRWDESDRRISQDEYEKIHSKFSLKKGDVLLTIVGSIGETAILKDPEGITFQRSVAFLRPNEYISSDFLYAKIQTPAFQKDLESRKSTSAQPGIYLGDLAEIPVEYAPSLEEQIKIGEYFWQLDHLITLHQQKCEELKKIKKFMLQKMFV